MARPPAVAPMSTEPRFVPPYPPSWVDRLAAQVERLPFPYWLPYLVACLLLLALAAWLLTLAGQSLTLGIVFSDSLPFYGFWLLHYLDRRAAASLDQFRPAFTGTESEFLDIRWRLTTLPALPALFVTAAAVGIGFVVRIPWGMSSAFQAVDRLAFLATVAFAFLYAYHSVRQLRLVTWLYAARTRVDLHNAAPLYAFSTLSAHTAIGMLLLLSGAALITPEGFVGGWLAAGSLFAGLALLAFLLPLVGLHRSLARAKDGEIADLNRRWQACMSEVYRRIDRGDLAAADRVNTTLSALERARAFTERIPTWPWKPETLRGFVAALVLPLVISLLQYALKQVLG